MSLYQLGDIFLSRESTIFSWIIQRATKSEWSHASLFYDEKIVGAVPFRGVCFKPFSELSNYSVYRYKNLSDEHRYKINFFINANMSKPYDFLQVLLLGWRIITNKIDKYEDDPNPRAFECLEFVSEAYYSAGIKLCKCVDNLLPNMISESPLFERIQ